MFAFAVLTALLKLHGGISADSRPLASRSVEKTNAVTAGETNESNATAGAIVQTAYNGNVQRSVSVVKQDGSNIQKESTTSSETAAGRLSAEVSRGVDQKKSRATAKPGSPSSNKDSEQSPPVFRRPSFRAPAGGVGNVPAVFPTSGPVCGNLGNFPKSSKAIFPLPGRYLNSYDDTWGAARPQGAHEGTDLMAPSGTPEYAITDGTIVPVSGSNADGWNTLGGYAMMLRADYSIGPIHAGDLFYYAHMNGKSPLPIGTRVRAGQELGVAGDTGQGPEVTRGLFPPHLHLGWYDMSGARTNLPSGAMNPYPLLQWLKANGGTVAGGSKASYCIAPQRDNPVPSTGKSYWPSSGSPGRQPDLDTGTHKAAPSPIVEKNSKLRVQVRIPNQHRIQRQTTQTTVQGSTSEQTGSPEQNGPGRPGEKPKQPQVEHQPATHKPDGVPEKPLPGPGARPVKPSPPKPVAKPEKPARPAKPTNPATANPPSLNHMPTISLPGIGSDRPLPAGGANFHRWLKALIQQATAQAHPEKHKPAAHGPKGKKDRENAAAKKGHKKESIRRKQEKLDACPVASKYSTCKKKETPGATDPAPKVEKTTSEPVPASDSSKGGTTDSVAPVPPPNPSKTTDNQGSTPETTSHASGLTQTPEKSLPSPASSAGGTTASPNSRGGTTSE